MKPLHSTSRGGRMLRLAEYGFAVLGVLALAWCAAVYVRGRLFQEQAARTIRRDAARRAPPAPASVPAPPPGEGALLGRLRIPRLGLSVAVVEGVNQSDLSRAAGHIPGTALPGQSGNIGIAAHRDTFFRPLRNIRKDDFVTLETPQGDYRYRVVSTQVVTPDDVAVLYPTGHDCITLVTCFPFYYIGSAPKRFIVRAEPAA